MTHAAWFVPGRVELLGKHVDYLGGRSLTCATPWGITLRAERLAGDAGLDGADDVYAQAVLRRLRRDFGPLEAGARIRAQSNLPQGAGLSSSSAWVIALLRALAWANELPRCASWRAAGLEAPLAFAEYAAAVESGAPWGPFAGDAGVGTEGGAQDHVAIVAAEAGVVQQFAYRPARAEARAAWPAQWSLLVLDSGVVAEKSAAARTAFNRVAAAGRAGEAARRAQFLRECEVLVPAARAAIAAADDRALGEAAHESQQLAERVLGNQVEETVALVRLARACGAFAASAFGAGFGGAVWAAVATEAAERLRRHWLADYTATFPAHGAAWCALMRPAGGLGALG